MESTNTVNIINPFEDAYEEKPYIIKEHNQIFNNCRFGFKSFYTNTNDWWTRD